MRAGRSKTFNRRQLTIGLDLGDRFSYYSVLDEARETILEQKLPTNPEAMKRALEKNAAKSHGSRDRNAFSLGQPAVNRAGHEVIVGYARNARFIGESRRKDDRLDARRWHGWHASIPSY